MTSWKGERRSAVTDNSALPESGWAPETGIGGVAGGGWADACSSMPHEESPPGRAGREEHPARVASPLHPADALAVAPLRSGPADPVRELMHRHRILCARAVDPLEVAAVLEAHGVTDRTATRFKHRDVFSLAEELFARAPATQPDEASVPTPSPVVPAGSGARGPSAGAVLHLLPGTLCAVTLAALVLNDGLPVRGQITVGTVGALAVGVALRVSLRRIARPAPAVVPALSACWLIAYALFGDWLVARLLGDGPAPDGLPGAVPGGVLSLTFAMLPAALAARRFRVQARRRLAASRGLDDFASAVRPLILQTIALFAVALVALQLAACAVVEGRLPALPDGAAVGRLTALGVLLFLALLLTAHGFPSAAAVGLGAASLAETVTPACAVVLAALEIDPFDRLGPSARAVAEQAPGIVPAVICSGAVLALGAYALRALTGASAHHQGVAR